MPTAVELIATLQSTQRSLIKALQEEFYAEDLEPPVEAYGWSYEKLKAFMESGGDTAPVVMKATPTTSGVVQHPTTEACAAPSWGMGMFTSPLASSAFTRSTPGTLVVVGGKLPLASKGPIIWLTGAPDEVAVAAVAVRAATAIPVGGGRSNAQAVDVALEDQTAVEALISTQCKNGFKWVSPRDLLMLPAMRRASTVEVEAVTRAVSLLAWHQAHAFSGADGSPTTFVPGTLGRRRKLASGRSLYPRVDPVALVLVTSADGERVLLGRQKAFPPSMFTCVSGFVEHGESVECAAAREVLEETGIVIVSAELIASQPWPCGRGGACEVMLAVVARASPASEAIDVSGDGHAGSGELEEARWFDRPAVTKMLKALPGGRDVWVPGAFAAAHHLLARWEQRSLRVPGLP